MPSVGSLASRCAEKNRARQEKFCLALSGTFRAFPRVGQRVSLEETPKIKCRKKLRITNKNPPAQPGVFHRRVRPFDTSLHVTSCEYDLPAAKVLLLATR